MLVVRTSECRANPICQLVGSQQSVRLDHLPLAVNPFGLYCVEPWASLGQQTGDYPHSPPTLLDFAVVRSDPTPDFAAYVPARRHTSNSSSTMRLTIATPILICGGSLVTGTTGPLARVRLRGLLDAHPKRLECKAGLLPPKSRFVTAIEVRSGLH
jgi:hypothetical protein